MNNQAVQKKVNKSPRRRFKKSFLVVLIIFLISVLAIFSTTVFFPVKNVKVSGEELNKIKVYGEGNNYTEEQIIMNSGIKLGQNTLVISSKKVSDNLTVKLPYITSVKLKKQLNGNITITPTFARAIYALKHEAKYLITDKDLKILEQTETEPKDLIKVSGLKVKEAKLGYKIKFSDNKNWEYVKKISTKLKSYKFSVDNISINAQGAITAKVNSLYHIEFGSAGRLDEKLTHLKGMIDEKEKQNNNQELKVILKHYEKIGYGYFKPIEKKK